MHHPSVTKPVSETGMKPNKAHLHGEAGSLSGNSGNGVGADAILT